MKFTRMQSPLLISWFVFFASQATPAESTPPEPAVIEIALEHAYLCHDRDAVGVATRQLDAALSLDPQSAQLTYLKGFAHYAATHAGNPAKNKAASIAELEAATQILATARGDPWQSEAMALEGAIDGQLIALKGGIAAGMKLGPKSNQLTADALKRLPASPRVQLFRAEILAHTPAMFGGDAAAAAKLYQQAVDTFAAGEKGDGLRWGCVEALTRLGAVRRDAHDPAGARSAW
jgi:hypothetical protein